jgi:hypothetical protein
VIPHLRGTLTITRKSTHLILPIVYQTFRLNPYGVAIKLGYSKNPMLKIDYP